MIMWTDSGDGGQRELFKTPSPGDIENIVVKPTDDDLIRWYKIERGEA